MIREEYDNGRQEGIDGGRMLFKNIRVVRRRGLYWIFVPPSPFFYTRKKGKETIEIRKLISGCAFICEVNFRLEFIVGRDFSRD